MPAEILSVTAEDNPRVLARITTLFSQWELDLESVTVGPSERPHVSRITIVATAEDYLLEQVAKQLNKLVDVLKVTRLDPHLTVCHELALIRVRADMASRGSVGDLVATFKGTVVDVSPETMLIEAAGSEDKLSALIDALGVFGVEEMARTGAIAMKRGHP